LGPSGFNRAVHPGILIASVNKRDQSVTTMTASPAAHPVHPRHPKSNLLQAELALREIGTPTLVTLDYLELLAEVMQEEAGVGGAAYPASRHSFVTAYESRFTCRGASHSLTDLGAGRAGVVHGSRL
jgi:hypothetical protein